jgi:Ferritin-like
LHERGSGKPVDLDPQWQGASQIWGMQVRVIDTIGEDIFGGKFEANPFRDLLFGRVQGRQADAAASAYFQDGGWDHPFDRHGRNAAYDDLGNVLNAIGGSPNINKPGFVPVYPGPLPMMVEHELQVGLNKLTRDLVEKVFMRIEQPEHVVQFQMLSAATADRLADTPEYSTIGQFYDAIISKLAELNQQKNIFTGDRTRQVVDDTFYTSDELFPIFDLDTATRALNVVKQQGEGTDVDPFEADGQPAHYYRFWEILKGHKLIKDPVTGKPVWNGEAVNFDESKVYDLVANSNAAMYPPGTNARLGVDLANAAYSRLLNALHDTFNGAPSKLDTALAIMNEFRLIVMEKVLTQKTEPDGKVAAPSFEYVATV